MSGKQSQSPESQIEAVLRCNDLRARKPFHSPASGPLPRRSPGSDSASKRPSWSVLCSLHVAQTPRVSPSPRHFNQPSPADIAATSSPCWVREESAGFFGTESVTAPGRAYPSLTPSHQTPMESRRGGTFAPLEFGITVSMPLIVRRFIISSQSSGARVLISSWSDGSIPMSRSRFISSSILMRWKDTTDD